MGKLIAVIGSGGKTTSMLTLAKSMEHQRVLISTTTHIAPVEPPVCRVFLPDPTRQQLLEALEKPGIVCAGRVSGQKKLSALDEDLLREAVQAADLTICEADGSKRLPLKLHRTFEPVIPGDTGDCLIVAGLSALGRTVGETVHCCEQNPDWAPERIVGPEEILFCIRDSIARVPLPKERIHILLNQLDTHEAGEILEPLQAEGWDCRAASLLGQENFLRNWLMR